MKRMLLFVVVLVVLVLVPFDAFAQQGAYRPNVPREAQAATTTTDGGGGYATAAVLAGVVRDAGYDYTLGQEVKMTLWRKSGNIWERIVSSTCTDPSGYGNQGCPRNWDGYYSVFNDQYGNPIQPGPGWLVVTAPNRKSISQTVNLTAGYSQLDLAMETRDQFTWLEQDGRSSVRGNNVTLTAGIVVPYSNSWYLYADESLSAMITVHAEKDGESVLIAAGEQVVKINPGIYWTQYVKLGGEVPKLIDYPRGSRVCTSVTFTDASKTVIGRVEETCLVKEPAVQNYR